MQRSFLLTLILLLTALVTFAQQIPVGSCGIVNIYDAAGNRTKRTYFCNNGSNPYPQRPGASSTQNAVAIDSAKETSEFQEVDALYPNPTSGKFTITFSNSLDNATIHILDVNGKEIQQVKAAGNHIEFDLSSQASGIYWEDDNEKGGETVGERPEVSSQMSEIGGQKS